MPLFICEECRTIENTALGHYWAVSVVKFKNVSRNDKHLCSACTPAEFSDGSIDSEVGWHGRFERITATKELIEEYGISNFMITPLLKEILSSK